MTDNYDLDPHEHEAHTEEGHAPESKAEAWPDDQPPVDDFADPGTEETATASEETGMTHEEGVVDAEPKKSSFLPIIAGLGGLLFLGAILYWQFGHSSAPATSVPPPPPLQITQPHVPGTPPAADVAPKTAFAPADNAPSMPSPAVPSGPTGTAMPAAASASSTSVAFAPAPPFPSATAPLPQANGAGINEALETRLNNLSTRIDELKRGLDQAMQQLGQMNVALVSPSAPGNGALEDRLTKIEQQVEQMQHVAASPSPVIASPSVAAQEASVSQAMDNTAASSAAKWSVHKESSYRHKKTKSVAHKKTSRHVASSSSAVSGKWVLRAATPDEAWVSKDESSSELRHVRVGEQLPGIGRVRAIRQVGDSSWVVEGSSGSVR